MSAPCPNKAPPVRAGLFRLALNSRVSETQETEHPQMLRFRLAIIGWGGAMRSNKITSPKSRPCFSCIIISLTIGAIVVVAIWRAIKDGFIHL